jgi:hypothetical protein
LAPSARNVAADLGGLIVLALRGMETTIGSSSVIDPVSQRT